MRNKLADGVEFKLGMTVYFGATADFAALETDPRFHEIETFQFEGHTCHCLNRIGSGAGTDLLNFFSTKIAAIEAEIKSLRSKIRSLELDIAELEAQKDAPPIP